MTQNKNYEEPQLLNVQKSAAFLGVSPSSIRQWALSNKLKGIKLGSRGDWRFTKEELSKLIQIEKDKFLKIRIFLKTYATQIQKISTEKEKHLIHDEKKSSDLNKHRKEHVEVIKMLADNLNDVEKGKSVFNKLGEKLAKQAVSDGLTIESAVDGTIFIKQAVWQKLEQEGLLYELTVQDFYKISNIISTYTDILASKIAFAYHDFITTNLNYLQISDSIPAMVAVYNIHTGEYIYVNKSISKLLGYSPKDFTDAGLNFVSTLVHPDDIPQLMKKNSKALKNANKTNHPDDKDPIISFEYRMKHKDGRWIWLLTEGSVFARDKTGKVDCVLNASIDITERKEAEEKAKVEEALKQSEELFSKAFHATPIAITITRLSDGNWIDANKHFLQLTEYSRDEIIGHNSTNLHLIVEEKSARKRKERLKSIQSKEKLPDLEFTIRTKSGKLRQVVSSSVLLTLNGQKHVISLHIDVTEQRKAVDALKQLSQQKDEFISMASHELKTPITSAKMFIDILEKETNQYNNELVEKYVKRLREQMSRLQIIVSDLLDLSRIETGKLHFNKDKFNLAQILADTIEAIQPITHIHIITFKTDESLPVFADRFRIYQVITNLLTNAIKYSPTGGNITITAKRKNGRAVVSIKDRGVGITKRQQKKIFEKLYQVTDPHKKTFPGLGMGLYISKEIIERHRGKIWVESAKGKGSTFFFSLPVTNK